MTPAPADARNSSYPLLRLSISASRSTEYLGLSLEGLRIPLVVNAWNHSMGLGWKGFHGICSSGNAFQDWARLLGILLPVFSWLSSPASVLHFLALFFFILLPLQYSRSNTHFGHTRGIASQVWVPRRALLCSHLISLNWLLWVSAGPISLVCFASHCFEAISNCTIGNALSGRVKMHRCNGI